MGMPASKTPDPYKRKASCDGCGAPFCNSGCEYCGRGQQGGDAVSVAWNTGMAVPDYRSQARLMTAQHNPFVNDVSSALSRAQARYSSDYQNSRSNMGGLPLPVWAAIFG